MVSGSDIQIDKGNYTRVHNAILEVLAMTELNGRELRCLLHLLRSTYGFNRKEAVISLTEWCKATKITRGHVNETLKRLVDRNIITKATEGAYMPATWAFNKHHETWGTSTPMGTGFNGTQGGTGTSTQVGTIDSTQGGTGTSTPLMCSTGDAKESIKERSKESIKTGEYAPGLELPKQRAEKVIADDYTAQAKELGLQPAQFVAMVNVWLDIIGARALVDAGDTRKLDYVKGDTLILARLGYCDRDAALDLVDKWHEAYPYKTGIPTLPNLKDYASQTAETVKPKKKYDKPMSLVIGNEKVTIDEYGKETRERVL